MKRTIAAICCGLALTAGVYAGSPVIDGVDINATTWGTPLAIQDTNTQFGNNFNELNVLFADSDADNLYIGIPGNISDGFTGGNTMLVFIDTDPLDGTNPIATEPGGGCPSTVPGILRYFNGTTFDPGFTPDYVLTIAIGIFPGQSTGQLVYSVDLTNIADPALPNVAAGLGAVGQGGTLTGDSGILYAIDNSNVDGVGDYANGSTPGDTGDDPLSADTGFEMAIPRSLLGIETSTTINLCAYISNAGNDDDAATNGVCNRRAFSSNQSLPGLLGADNLGVHNGDTITLDFSDAIEAPGIQFIPFLVLP